MGLNRAFCDLQIARDFRVVTSLEKKINDLLLPAPQSAERFFHVLHLATVQVPPTNLEGSAQSPAHLGFGCFTFASIRSANSATYPQMKCEKQ
jgi:hypothetical protein